MNQLEENITRSFINAKNDIIQLQNTVSMLSENQERQMEVIKDTQNKENELYNKMKKAKTRTITKTVTRKVVAKKKQMFVGSKSGKKLHEVNCPFAKNIQPKTKVRFHSKAKALNEGFKLCECLKK